MTIHNSFTNKEHQAIVIPNSSTITSSRSTPQLKESLKRELAKIC